MPVYRIDIFKAWANREIERAWSNSYEIFSEVETPAELVLIANDIVTAEKAIHLNRVEFLQHRVSTFEIEPTGGYDPEAFVTTPLEGTGARGTDGNSQPLDFNVCYVVQRVPATGRAGRLFYRGCLTEADVDASLDGTFRLVPNMGVSAAAVQTAYRAPLQILLGNGPLDDDAVSLVMASTLNGQLYFRYVQDLRNGGVSINKRNHRYFDRGANG